MANLGPLLAITTTGIATIDIPAIMYALFGLEPTKAAAQKFIDYIYKRFGARPDFEQLPGVVGPQGEFFARCSCSCGAGLTSTTPTSR